jgi:hypothetical protein
VKQPIDFYHQWLKETLLSRIEDLLDDNYSHFLDIYQQVGKSDSPQVESLLADLAKSTSNTYCIIQKLQKEINDEHQPK